MKKHALYTLLMVMACTFTPTTAQNYVLTSVAEKGSTYLETEKNVYFGTAADERLVEINTNVDFTVEGGSDWCKVQKEGTAINISVTENTDTTERTTEVSFKAKDGLSHVMEIYQHGTDAEKYPTFAVISDVHFGNSKGEGPMVKVPRTLKNLTAKGKLDAIIVVGDLTEGGYENQYDQFVQVFTDEENFINPVDTMLFMLGNHDNYGGRKNNYVNKLRGFNNGNDYPYDQYTVIKGYPFITISVRGSDNNDDTNPADGPESFPQDVQNRLATWLERAAQECPGKPIFVFAHVPPKYTCYSTWPGEGDGTTWPTWGMRTINPILNKYPQVVVFGGHSHYPLGDPRSIHQGVDPNSDKQNYYTGVGTGSVTYSEIQSPAVDWSDPIHPNFYDHITEGLIVDVKPEGNVEIRRYDTRLDEEIQPENRWNLEPPFDGSKFAYADARDIRDNIHNKPYRTGLPAPAFAADATMNVQQSGAGITVTFPQATDNDCVFRYKVTVLNDKGFAIKNSWIFSEFYKNSEMPDSFTVSYTGLEPAAEHTIVVEAYDSYDNISEALTYGPYIQGGDGDYTVPTRIGSWDFDTPNDTLVSSEGSVELTPSKVLGSGTISSKKALSDINVTYVDGPTDENGAIRIPKGSVFRIKSSKKLSSYTLMLDIKIPDYKFRALLQTNRSNDEDADIFINREGAIGLGVTDLGYGGKCQLNTWHRVVISTDNGCPSVYLDGEKICQGTTKGNTQWVINANSGLLFCDNNGEMAELDVAEIGLWDVALSEGEVLSLGFYKHPKTYEMTVNESSFDLTEVSEFNVNVSATIEPSFTFPEWIYMKRPVPSIGTFTYIFGVEPMPEGLSERSGELIVSAPEGSGIEPVVIPLTQTCSNPEVPTAAGIWTFDNADKLLDNSGKAKYTVTPAKMNGTAMELTASGIKQVAGPAPENNAILLPKETMLNLQFVESSSTDKKKNYTVMYDIRESSFNFEALLQPNLQNNTDAMFFINQNGQIGHYAQGNWGYGGQVKANTWHRIVITVKNGVPNAYLDGALVTPGKNTFNGAWELDPTACFLFADNDGERLVPEVAEIRYWDKALTTSQVATLGLVTVVDTPQDSVEVPTCDGQWLFDNADDIYANKVGDTKLVPYKEGAKNTAPTAYDPISSAPVTKGEKGISLKKETSLFMPLNEENDIRSYTLIVDVKAADVTNGYISMFQTNPANNEDAEIFIAKNMIGLNGTGGLGYGGQLQANTWYRLAFVVNDGIISTYINGSPVGTSANTFNDRWCLNKEGVFLFLDNDGEHKDLDVAGIHFWKQPLSNAEIKTLGGAE